MNSARARRGVVTVWVLLGGLVGTIAVIEYADHRHATSDRGGARDPGLLLPVPVEQLGAIEIANRGRLHRFERDAGGSWFYHGAHGEATAAHTHASDPVLAERIGRVVATFGRARIERHFTAADREGTAYGVTPPELVVLAYRPNEAQPLAQYAIGHVAPDTVSQYVNVVGSPVVVTVPKYQIDNLLALVEAAGETSGDGRR